MAKLNLMMLAPPVVFAGLVGVLAFGLGGNEDTASARQGGAAPALFLSDLQGNTFTSDDLMAPGVKLVNFWASWCAPCRAEHAQLEQLREDGVPIYGINYKDDPADALAFLDELGNPYEALGADPNARTALEWGVAGVPETYVIDGDGTIIFRFAGPITPSILASTFEPIIAEAQE
ncbi:DsbE family thiol:disulfide interchange protein [Cochlodiniinecator piscidefendens]|uniref:DsbE family thiol:disulfide interchange protein n=1 Tax=Cochlodiniinecator piscidefendens TaxID=2715756 RepID=UPI00140C7081|nr:DsbE family thiol:disulfide interchange protein [Cochlodiniinecator piscidefendens]